MKRLLLLAASVVSLSLAACEPAPAPLPTVTLQGPASVETFTVEIADNDESRQRGLMERTSLAPDSGMLFIMEEPRELSFWMKNTLIPLDILFFDAGGRLVSTHTMTPCEADPCKNYRSGKPALYALEVAAGTMREKGIGSGWTLVPPSR